MSMSTEWHFQLEALLFGHPYVVSLKNTYNEQETCANYSFQNYQLPGCYAKILPKCCRYVAFIVQLLIHFFSEKHFQLEALLFGHPLLYP